VQAGETTVSNIHTQQWFSNFSYGQKPHFGFHILFNINIPVGQNHMFMRLSSVIRLFPFADMWNLITHTHTHTHTCTTIVTFQNLKAK